MIRIDITKYKNAQDKGYKVPLIAFFKNGYYLVEDLCGHSAKYKEIQDYSNFYNQCYKGLYKWPEIEITTVDESIGRYVSYEKQ